MPRAKRCLHGKSAHRAGLGWIGVALGDVGGGGDGDGDEMERDGERWR